MNKPKILMLDQPCEEACKLIDEVAERTDVVMDIRDFGFNVVHPDYVWTGLTPFKTDYATVFSPCTGVDHIKAPEIIHLDEKWRQNEGQQITSTAEHTLSLILQLAKKAGIQLSNKSIGIVGLGRIGNYVADYTFALDMDLYVYDKYTLLEQNSITDNIQSLDVITLHVPLNDETRHMIGKKEIEMMNPGALLINTSRQEVVDIEAVKEALISKKIYYADDFKDKVDLTEYGAIQTPHIGGNTIESRKLTDIYIAKKLQEYIRRR